MPTESGPGLPSSRIWSAIASVMGGRYGPLVVFVWAFAEALSWFIIAEMVLILFAAAVPHRVMKLAAATIAGSVLGVLTNSWLASRGVLLPMPLTTGRMAAIADHQFSAEGPSAVINQALSGIPVKVYARAAGQHGVGLWQLAGWTLLARGLRISTVGLVIWGLGSVGAVYRRVRRSYGWYLILVSVAFTAALSAIIAAYS